MEAQKKNVSPKGSIRSNKSSKTSIGPASDAKKMSPRAGGYLNIDPTRVQSHKTDGQDEIDPKCTCKNKSCKEGKLNESAATPTAEIKSSKDNMISFSVPKYNYTRAYIIKQSVQAGHFRRHDDIEEEDSDGPDETEGEDYDDELVDTTTSTNLLTGLISTVMLMASGVTVPPLLFDSSRALLKCIKDDEGNTPPNVQGILNNMELIQPSSDEKDVDEKDADEKDKPKEAPKEVDETKD